LIVEVEQEIEEKMENDWQSKIKGEELLSDVEESDVKESDVKESDVKESDVKESDVKESDVKESDVESDKGYNLLTRQLDFV
jgi:hypothetical protein